MPEEQRPDAEQPQPADPQPADQQPAEQQPAEQQPAEPQPDDFAARTAAAEALPLPERADAFAALHDDLRTRLESGQTATTGHSSGRAAGAGQVWGSGRADGGTRG
ncbi:hypothetical protein [Curtobacterium caseinilyticum]|uniref:Uncharacterized protein n=1 Tax=Curtobacterium caseinilyticum TaxID=3055137 RepID=A0ABT7TTQ1_9MICO|nr:hypothetical protein [Curtobacterium caseinilyticum]MDM7892989.1 hypothetical protein [Curtobacterium caseinilyticum]